MSKARTDDSDAAIPMFGRGEAELLADALEVDPAQIEVRTREPLGAGSVAGVDVHADGRELRYYVDTSRYPVATETGLVRGNPASPEARVWLHPADPHLPALAAAAFGHAAEALLARLGITAVMTPAIVAYRPGRRAVVRIATAEGFVWIKVVRPSRAQRIVELHERLGQAGVPVPRVLGWAPSGLIVIEDARGVGAPEVEWEPGQLLDAVDRLRAQFGRARLPGAVTGASVRLPWYCARLNVEGAGEIERRAAQLVAHLTVAIPLVTYSDATVHGDLHFGQLFLDASGEISAVIDVDTAGTGDPAEDSAAFIAHAVASALITETESRERVWHLADASFERWGDDDLTRLLTVVHLVGHAIGALDRSESEMADALIRIAEGLLGGSVPSSTRPKSALTHSFGTA